MFGRWTLNDDIERDSSNKDYNSEYTEHYNVCEEEN